MALRPDYVHKLIDRMTSAYLRRLDQLESLGLISSNNDNSYNSSGGHGYTDAVPDGRSAPSSGLRTSDVWGRAMSQIFSEVSPEMHDEFALQHEMRWLERFGVCYYGCCEPLHRKVGILKKVPRLRKISMSPWVKFEEAVENVGDKYVFSMKPNPAFLAEHTWSPEKVRDDLRKKLAMAKGCVVEIILKDISSAGNDPRRLWEWADTAAAAAREFEP
jgi:hypothetical protein